MCEAEDEEEEGEGEGEGEEKVVTTLRSELWEKERKLTDIRLEALSSAHQLEQLREAMTNMEVCARVCVGIVMPGSQACQITESHTGFNAKQYDFI